MNEQKDESLPQIGWLGALVMLWVLIIGFTGFYLNHTQLVLGAIGYSELSESDLAGAWELAVTQQLASRLPHRFGRTSAFSNPAS